MTGLRMSLNILMKGVYAFINCKLCYGCAGDPGMWNGGCR